MQSTRFIGRNPGKKSPAADRERREAKGQPKWVCSRTLQESLQASVSTQCRVMKAHPFIPLVCFFLFVILLGSSIAIVEVVKSSEYRAVVEQATTLAAETGTWFAKQLDQAIAPVFALAQFAVELEMFRSLSSKIGPFNETTSLPFLPSPRQVYRNVSGVCDDPELVNRFNEIAATIKRHANMDGILVNLQLAPQAVVCLVYPLNNTEDFPDGIFLDISGSIGHDLLFDPDRRIVAEATIPLDKVVVTGPLTLKQCESCDPSVEQSFIVRFPIEVPDHQIEVHGVSYNRWGFAVAIIN